MLMKQRMTRKTRGFTLTEAAIVLGIVGLILGAIWVAAGAVYNNQRVATTTTQVLQMVNGIRSLYATSTTFSGTILELANAGVVPKDMVTLNASGVVTNVDNVWNGAVTIAAASPATGFILAYPNVPREACSSFLVRITGRGRDSGLEGAGTTSPPPAVPSTGLNVTAATAACSSLTNTVYLEFALRS